MLLGIGLHGFVGVLPRALVGSGPHFRVRRAVRRVPVGCPRLSHAVFFLMSGFFTALLWRRRGLGALLNHRLRRVALPLLIGLLTIVPLTSFVGDWAAESAPATQLAEDDIWGRVFAGDVSGVERLLDRRLRCRPAWGARGMDDSPCGCIHGRYRHGRPAASRVAPSRHRSLPPRRVRRPSGWPSTSATRKRPTCWVAYGGGDSLPEGIEWSEIPGWGAGSADADNGDGSADGLDLSEIQRFYHLWFLWFLLWLVAGFALVAWVVDRRVAQGSRQAEWPRWVMWTMIPLTLFPQLLMGEGGAYPVFGPDTSDDLVPFPTSWPTTPPSSRSGY